MTIRLLSGPAVEPLDLATAKVWARIDSTGFDAILPMMIAAARQHAEQETGSKLITQTWRQELDDWPSSLDRVALFPVQSISVTYWNGTAWVAADFGLFITVRSGFAVSLRSTTGYFPALGPLVGPRIRIDYVLGYGDSYTAVPEAIRSYMAVHIALWIRNPEGATERYALFKNPFLDGLVDPFRVYS